MPIRPCRSRARRQLVLALAASTVLGGLPRGAPAQASSNAIPDSLFQPIVLPQELVFGYPPNAIHLPQIVEMARERDFGGLDAMLQAIEADVRRDVTHEARFRDAFESFDRDDSALVIALDAWIAARPASAHARVARARYYIAAAWRRRGTAHVRDMPPDTLHAVEGLAKRAVDDATAALKMDSTHLVAYEIAIDAAQLLGSREEAREAMRRGLAIHRGSYNLYRALMLSLWPRWGGSERLMIQLADEAARNADLNQRLVTLRGAVHEARAFDSTLAGNHAGAIRELNRAVLHGPERNYLALRGQAYFELGAYQYAFSDLRAALIDRSQDKRALAFYGRTLVELADDARPAIRPAILARAIEVLALAVYLDPANTAVSDALGRARRMGGE